METLTKNEIYIKYQSRIDKIVHDYYAKQCADETVTDDTTYSILSASRTVTLSKNESTVAAAIAAAIHELHSRTDFDQEKTANTIFADDEDADYILNSLDDGLRSKTADYYLDYLSIQTTEDADYICEQ